MNLTNSWLILTTNYKALRTHKEDSGGLDYQEISTITCRKEKLYTFNVNICIVSTSSVYSIRLPENICQMMKNMDDVNWSEEIRGLVERTVKEKAKSRLLARAAERRKHMKNLSKSAAEMIREDRDAR
jgi:hypothetical protein